MQEFRKTLRKVAAIGASVAMLGMTVTGALAADYTLADYPKPFENGGSTVVVYGAAATADDTAAAGDIISGLPAVAGTSTSSTTTSTTTNAGTVELDTASKYTKDVVLGIALNDATAFGNEIRDTRVSGMKAGSESISIGSVSNTYDYHEKMNFTSTAYLATGLTMGETNASSERYGSNVMLKLGQNSVGYYYHFDATLKSGNEINMSTVSNPIFFDFLGKTVEIQGASSATSLSAIAGDKFSMEVGDSVVVGGKKVVLEAIGSTSARVSVDGESATIITNYQRALKGLNVRVQDLIDVGSSNSNGKSSCTLVVGTDALKTYTTGDNYIGQDKNNPLWEWDLGGLTGASPVIGVRLHQSLTSTSISIPDYPLTHPPYVGDLLCLPNNYMCLSVETVTQSDDDFGLYEISPQVLSLYDTSGSSLKTDVHVIQLKARSTTSGTGFKANASTDTSTILIYTQGTNGGNEVELYRQDTTLAKPLIYANYSIVGNPTISIGTIDYKSTSLPIYLKAYNDTTASGIASTQAAWGSSYFSTGLVENATVNQFQLVVNHTSGAADQLHIFFKESSADQLNYLGHRTTGGTYQSNDLLYIPAAGGAAVDISAYASDARMKSGVIIQTPRTGIENDQFLLKVPKDASNYKANLVLAKTKGGAAPSVIKGVVSSASIMKKDSDVTDVTLNNAIVVGGPAVNKIAADLLGKTFPAYGANSGLNPNEAVIELKKNGANYALIVAGWEADDTKRAGVVLKNYASFKDSLKGTSVTVKGTGMEIAGITVA